MALNSPGVEVDIIDQSTYLPAASSSVPLILLATATNKADSTGVTIAPGTLAANANKLYQITSQRDLVNTFGTPFFYKTSGGTPIHGYELNEYGLLAAYSLLGVTNQCWILRANVDLASLVGTLVRPAGAPADGTYWLDTTNSTWGIFELDAANNVFNPITPIVIYDTYNLTQTGGTDSHPIWYPKQTIGNIGDYAVVPIQSTKGQLYSATYFYKDPNNLWQEVGTHGWKMSYATVAGSTTANSNNLTAGNTFNINIQGNDPQVITITIPGSPNNNAAHVATMINSFNIGDLYAEVDTQTETVLSIYYGEYGSGNKITLTQTGTVLSDLGIAPGDYYAPDVAYGTSAQMPLWTSSQSNPRPSGSVWIKTSVSGAGMNLVLSKYSTTSASFNSVTTSIYTDEMSAMQDLDPTGGQVIPANTIFAMVGTNGDSGTKADPESGIIFYRRTVTGPTVVTSTLTSYAITQNSVLRVVVSMPNSNAGSAAYDITMSGTGSNTFLLDWAAAQIPYTTATVTTSGAIQLTHTLGGDIYLSDADPATGISNGLLVQLGFQVGYCVGARYSYLRSFTFMNPSIGSATHVNPAAQNATFNVTNTQGHYVVSIATAGTNYTVGDTFTIYGNHLGGQVTINDLKLVVTSLTVSGGGVAGVAIYGASGSFAHNTAPKSYYTALSNWAELTYTASAGAPTSNPLDGTNWFYSTPSEVDIMVKVGTQWKGYKNTKYDLTGHPTTSGNPTDPLGVILQPNTPTTQSDGKTALAYGDLWLNTGDLENYPNLSRWENVNGVNQWVSINNADHVSSSGIVFADARWTDNTGGSNDPVNDPITPVHSLLTSNYVDLDAPNPALYPQGMLLFNTRRSGYNVKQFKANYFTQANYSNLPTPPFVGAPTTLPQYPYTWVSVSGLKNDGSAYMGRKAQRNLVVEALKAAINTNTTIREEDNFMNLLAAPGYPELQPDMVVLNNDRHNTGYIIGDTPLRLADNATGLTQWATNAAGATETGEEGWVTRDEYLATFYPSGITSDLSGTPAVVPSSHMMLYTFLQNDTVAYPWLAAAGTRRGLIANATNIGYLNGTTGEFITIKNRVAIRDVLYENQINPLAYFTGIGLLNYGNKSSFASNTAMDRTNVGRLIAYIRYQLQIATRPFIFEPNDALTRTQVTGVVQSLFIDLVAKRGLYDYLVVCDSTNNTPARIDRNELWIDIAIEPVKSTEFIYIPVRILNTGGIAKLK